VIRHRLPGPTVAGAHAGSESHDFTGWPTPAESVARCRRRVVCVLRISGTQAWQIGSGQLLGSLVDLPGSVCARSHSPRRPRATPPNGRLENQAERSPDAVEVAVVHAPVIELAGQLLKQVRPLLPTRLTFAATVLDDGLPKNLHGDEPRLCGSFLLPSPAPASGRAPPGQPTSRLGPERRVAPLTRHCGGPAHRHDRALGMGRSRCSKSSWRTLMLRGPTLNAGRSPALIRRLIVLVDSAV